MPDDPLAAVRGRLDEVVEEVLDALHRRVPHYAQMPRVAIDTTVRDVVYAAIEAFLASLSDDRMPSDAELQLLRDSAAVRAQQQIPLESVLGDYFIGTQVVWSAIHDAADGADVDRLWHLSHRMLAVLEVIWEALVAAYLEEHRAVFGEHRQARDALLDALVSGAALMHLSERAGMRLPSHWVVASVSFWSSRSGAGSRRLIRAVEASIMGHFGPQTLVRLDDVEGWVLVPTAGDDLPGKLSDVRDTLCKLAGHDLELVGAIACCPAEDLSAAADLTRELHVLARRLGRAGRVFDLDDLLLEHALSRPSASTDRLRELLTPLDGLPDLSATLEAWFDSGFHRRDAAARLHVHPNTLDYRLRRVSELLDVDLKDPGTIFRLGGALVARRVQPTAGRPTASHVRHL